MNSHREANLRFGGLMMTNERESERGPAELEAEIDRLTDEELAVLFRKHSNYDIDPDMSEADIVNACEYSVQQFRRNPRGWIYRGYVREALTKIKSRSRNNQ